MSGKRRKRKVLVIAQVAWFHMDRLNISQNELAELLDALRPSCRKSSTGPRVPRR